MMKFDISSQSEKEDCGLVIEKLLIVIDKLLINY